jgi:Raf kinase inhibitor-like YbhB/YbcL family protein
MKLLHVKSVFPNNGRIPDKYTCKGEDVNPEIIIEGIPVEAKSLALIVDDPDAPMGTWDHWIVWNIKPLSKIAENSVPGVEGVNSAGQKKWHGPCPPSGTHRYFFKVFALDCMLNISNSSRKVDLEKAMKGHIIAKGELVGLYSKN